MCVFGQQLELYIQPAVHKDSLKFLGLKLPISQTCLKTSDERLETKIVKTAGRLGGETRDCNRKSPVANPLMFTTKEDVGEKSVWSYLYFCVDGFVTNNY